MQIYTEQIAQRVRSLRMAKNFKQAELDVAAKLPRTSISKIETGKREAAASELVMIAHALGVNLDTLVSGENAFVYLEEIKVIEALREIPFEDYKRILGTVEAQVYFTSKDAKGPRKDYLHDLVQVLINLAKEDRRPRGRYEEVKRIR